MRVVSKLSDVSANQKMFQQISLEGKAAAAYSSCSVQCQIQQKGRKDKELFDKFMCYCTDNTDKLEHSVEVARADIGEYEATIKELTGSNAALELEIKDVLLAAGH